MEKQIEEMAKQLYGNFGLSMPTARNVAKYLTKKKGYRKSKEVALEFIEAVDEMMELVTAMTGLSLTYHGKYAELKKKYTKMEKDNGI